MLGRFFAGNWRPRVDEINRAAANGFEALQIVTARRLVVSASEHRPSGQTTVRHWSDTGQTLVRAWSEHGQSMV
jgi:hypothetical protein